MSKTAIRIQKFYKKGFYTKEMVHALVGKALGITAEEYEIIVGEPYVED